MPPRPPRSAPARRVRDPAPAAPGRAPRSWSRPSRPGRPGSPPRSPPEHKKAGLERLACLRPRAEVRAARDGGGITARPPPEGRRFWLAAAGRREGKMPVAVMAENSFSFKKLLEQCETQELEVPRGGGRATGTGPGLPGAWLRPRVLRRGVGARCRSAALLGLGTSASGRCGVRWGSETVAWKCCCESLIWSYKEGCSWRSASVCVCEVGEGSVFKLAACAKARQKAFHKLGKLQTNTWVHFSINVRVFLEGGGWERETFICLHVSNVVGKKKVLKRGVGHWLTLKSVVHLLWELTLEASSVPF